MNIFDTITLLKAGYTKKEIEAMKAEPAPEADIPASAPAEISAPAGDPAPAPAEQAEPAEDPRIAQLEAQVKELQGKLIQLNTVNTIPAEKDIMLEIGNTLINGGRKI